MTPERFRSGRGVKLGRARSTGHGALALDGGSGVRSAGRPVSEVHFDMFGRGPDVVLLHGSATPPGHLRPVAEAISASRRVWVAHLPGYGRSTPLPQGHAATDIADELERALLAHGVKQAAWVGASAGGYLALALALRNRVATSVVVTLGGYATLAPEHRAGLRELAAALRAGGIDLPSVLVQQLLSPARAEADPQAVSEVRQWASAKPPALLADELEALAACDDLTPGLAGLDATVVARVGTLDVACPPAYSEAIAQAARHGTLERVAGAGHALVLEDFDATVESVRRALAGER